MLLYKHSSTFLYWTGKSLMKEGLKKMINLITNWILSFLSLLDFLSFGILDNIAVIYSILIITSLIVFVKLEATIEICGIWKKAGVISRGLIMAGLIFNALPQWYLWLVGLCFIALAYFLTPLKTNKSGRPSLFSKIKAVVVEEYQESDFKAKTSSTIQKVKKVSKNKSGTKPMKELPPV